MSRQLIKLKFLILAVVLLVVACEKDIDEFQIQTTENTTITKKLLSTKQVKQNKKIKGFLDDFQENSRNNTYKSRGNDSINGFSVDTNEAIYLEKDDYHSYTFTVYGNPEEGILENLVLSLNKEASYDAYLWRYDKGANEIIDETTPIEVIKLGNLGDDTLITTQGYPCQNGWRIEIDYVDNEGYVHDNLDDDCAGCYAIGNWVQCSNSGGGSSAGGTGDGNGDGDGDGDSSGNGNGDNDSGNDDDIGDIDTWDGASGENDQGGGSGSSGSNGSSVGNDIRDNTIITTPNEKCKGGKVKIDGICQCPEGKVEDEVGNCVHQSIYNDDCSQLGALSDVPLIKTRLNQLRIASGNFEKGLKISKDPSNNEYVPSPILENASGSNHINIIVNGFTSAIAHTHPNYVFYKMFSAPDILKMAQTADRIQNQNNSTVQLTEITHILIFNINGTDFTFALRFDDLASVQKLQDIVNEPKDREEFEEDLLYFYENDNSGPPAYQPTTSLGQQQQHMFNLFNKYNLNMSLYEANFNSNGTIGDWQRINKDSLDKEPCN